MYYVRFYKRGSQRNLAVSLSPRPLPDRDFDDDIRVEFQIDNSLILDPTHIAYYGLRNRIFEIGRELTSGTTSGPIPIATQGQAELLRDRTLQSLYR